MFQFEVEDNSSESADLQAGDITSIASTTFSVGDKVIVEKSTGAVRYIGAVGTYPGTWLGIEWDDSTRGKHNGTVDEVKYFDCLNSNTTDNAKAASFVRPQKVKKCTNIISALHARYGHDEKIMAELKLMDERIERLKINYQNLVFLDLSGFNILGLGAPDELATFCPSLQYLALAENQIQNWSDVVQLCRKLKLKRLDLSENPIEAPTQQQQEAEENAFPTLEHVILGKVGYDWEAIVNVSCMWPQVSNLQVPYNNVTTLSAPPPQPSAQQATFANLTQLDLSGNKITDWEEVLKLSGQITQLEYLNLSENKINNISFPQPQPDPRNPADPTGVDVSKIDFPTLSRLNLSSNNIQSWSSIDELHKLTNLHELRIDQNPFLEKDRSKESNRQHIIAKIGKLLKLEGVEINRVERRDSELDYVKKLVEFKRTASAELKQSLELIYGWKCSNDDLDLNPRHQELYEKYDETANPPPPGEQMSSRTHQIIIELIPQDDKTMEPMRKEVSPNMPIQTLQVQTKRWFNLKVFPMKIQYEVISYRNPEVRFMLENPFKELGDYSVENNDQLLFWWEGKKISAPPPRKGYGPRPR